MIAITTATVVVFRLLYNKVIFKDCCNKKMTKVRALSPKKFSLHGLFWVDSGV